MLKVDIQTLEKLEKLSMVEIKDEEKKNMIKNLSEIVDFVENLNELDLKNSDASFAMIKGGTPFRDDKAYVNNEVIEIILQNAPKKESGFFVVPKIIE